MSEPEFRATLDPLAIVQHRATVGGPQPAEMARMIKASNQQQAAQGDWIASKRARIQDSLTNLDRDFEKLLLPK
jgi:argininosuccinate lyase